MSNNNQEIINRFINGAKIKNTYEAFGVAEIDYSKIALVRFVNTNYMGVLYFGFIESNGQNIQAINLGVEDDELEVSARSVGGVVYSKIYSGKLLDSDYEFIYDYNKSASTKGKRIKKLYFNDGKVINIYGTATMKELEEICNKKEKINMSKENNNKVTNKELSYSDIEDKLIKTIVKHKEKIVSIFDRSRITENGVSTLIDNIEEFVELVRDEESFKLFMDDTITYGHFIASCITTGKSNEEINVLIDKINSEFKIENHFKYKELESEIFNNTLDVLRNSKSEDECFENILDIYNNYTELKDAVVEEFEDVFVTRIGYTMRNFIEDLAKDKKFVFAILLGILNESNIKRLESSISNKEHRIRKLKTNLDNRKIKQIEELEVEIEYIEERITEVTNDKNRTLAKLFRYRQEIDKLNLQ